METIKAIELRKSIRSYQEKEIDKATLETLASCANKAPSSGEIHVTVITNKEILETIDAETLDFMKNSGTEFLMKRASIEGYHPIYGAPALILLSSPDPDRGMPGVAAAATTVILAATDMGLGSCYVASPTRTVNTSEKVLPMLSLPEGYSVLAGVLLGYTDDKDKFSRERVVGDNISFIE